MKARSLRFIFISFTFLFAFLPALVSIQPARANTQTGGEAVIRDPLYVAGFSGHSDARDADIYPVIAFDETASRYLVVWAALTNANSSSDSFDLYGVFLMTDGRPIGKPFRISDNNTVSRNTIPAIAAGQGEFFVAWAKRSGACSTVVQRVTDATNTIDIVVAAPAAGAHSPALTYNRDRKRFALLYVEGDDYLPPSISGADTAGCGNNPSSRSSIKGMEIYWNGSALVQTIPASVSDVSLGAFRPEIAYDPVLKRYWAVWEDRRNAITATQQLGVYAQAFDGSFVASGLDVALLNQADFANDDGSSTWTPRPTVVSGLNGALAAWFVKESADPTGANSWAVKAALLPASGAPGAPFTVTRYTYSMSHPGAAPSGFLSSAYTWSNQEYLLGITSYMESLWGYHSFALVQRISPTGQLLDKKGNALAQASVGVSIDYSKEDQIAISLAGDAMGGMKAASILAVYNKHAVSKPANDTDIWGVRVLLPAPSLQSVALPSIRR